MRKAYALLGILFLIVLLGAYLAVERAYAPESDEVLDTEDATPVQSEQQNKTMLTLNSPAFADNGSIPSNFTCDGDNINPELHIGGVPEGALSLVLVMDDPDIPESVKESNGIEKFDHWALYNIPPDMTRIPEGEGDTIGSTGLSTRGTPGYVGPCPPDREHRYIFRLYALDRELSFDTPPTLDVLEVAAQEAALQSATLVGRYERTK